MATTPAGPIGTMVAELTKAAEEAAEGAVDLDMTEPGRTAAVASTHLAIMADLLAEAETIEIMGAEVASVVAFCYLDAAEVLNAALLAISDAIEGA